MISRLSRSARYSYGKDRSAAAAGVVALLGAFAAQAQIATTTSLTSSGTVGNYILSATVSGTPAAGTASGPTGTVTFVDTSNGNAVLATASLSSGGTPSSSITLTANATGITTPQGIAVADLNGDGIPDLAVTGVAKIFVLGS